MTIVSLLRTVRSVVSVSVTVGSAPLPSAAPLMSEAWDVRLSVMESSLLMRGETVKPVLIVKNRVVVLVVPVPLLRVFLGGIMVFCVIAAEIARLVFHHYAAL